RVGHIAWIVSRMQAIDAIAHDLAERLDVAGDHRYAREPGLEIRVPERLVLARHREDRGAGECLRLLRLAHDGALEPPRIARRRREERIPRRLSDRHELRVEPFAPDDPRRGAQRVIALVPLLASHEEDR